MAIHAPYRFSQTVLWSEVKQAKVTVILSFAAILLFSSFVFLFCFPLLFLSILPIYYRILSISISSPIYPIQSIPPYSFGLLHSLPYPIHSHIISIPISSPSLFIWIPALFSFPLNCVSLPQMIHFTILIGTISIPIVIYPIIFIWIPVLIISFLLNFVSLPQMKYFTLFISKQLGCLAIKSLASCSGCPMFDHLV